MIVLQKSLNSKNEALYPMWWLMLTFQPVMLKQGDHWEFKADWAISEWQVWLTSSSMPDG